MAYKIIFQRGKESLLQVLVSCSGGPNSWVKFTELTTWLSSKDSDQMSQDLVDSWDSRRHQVNQFFHVHGTSLARNSADCQGCLGDVSVLENKSPRVGDKRQRDEDIGEFTSKYALHSVYIKEFKHSVLSKYRSTKPVHIAQRVPPVRCWPFSKTQEREFISYGG